MPHHQAREPLSRDKIPYYVELAEEQKYGWVDNFIRWESKLIEVNRLEKELSEVKRSDPTFNEFAERVRGSYLAYRAKRVEAIAKRLYGLLQSPDPMAGFKRAQNPERFDVIEWPAVEEALAFLEANYKGGVTDEDRQKEITRIEKLIAKRRGEMSELLPPEQFITNDPQSNREINKAEAFTDFWRNLATWTRGAVGPRGRALRLSPPEEQAAYHALGLAGLTSRAARLEPYPE